MVYLCRTFHPPASHSEVSNALKRSTNLHPVRELAHAPIHPPLPPPPPYHPLDVLVTIELEGRGHLSHLSILTLMGLFLIGA